VDQADNRLHVKTPLWEYLLLGFEVL